MELRPYQVELVDKVRAEMRKGVRRIVVRSETGSGKTVLATFMLKSASDKGMANLFNVHRRELIKQSCLAFDKMGLDHGIISAGFQPDLSHLTQLCSIDTLRSRIESLPRKPKLVGWDEGHHLVSPSWLKVFHHEKLDEAYHIIFTATPERLDGKGLEDVADVIIEGPSMRWLIEEGYLVDYVAYQPGTVSMAGIKKQMGEYSKSESAALVDRPAITGSAVNEYLKVLSGKRCIGFAITIEHSLHIVETYNAAGIPAAHLDGETPSNVRDQVLQDFKNGKILYVSNVGLFSEGFDLPNLHGVQGLRPTASLAFWRQMAGRVLRPVYAPGFDLNTKEGRLAAIAASDKPHAVILDHVGNIERHRLPCEERKWSLQGRAGREKSGEKVAPIKICEKCYGAQPSRLPECKYCGFKFEVNEREIIEIDGELTKVDKEKMRIEAEKAKYAALNEKANTDGYDALVELGRKRGYKNPEKWAGIIHKSREAKKALKNGNI